MAQEEKAMIAFLQKLEGIEKDDTVFEAESAAWFAAVSICGYIATTEVGSRIRLTIHGEPYKNSVDHDPKLVAGIQSEYQRAIDRGVEVIRRDRPTLVGVLYKNPYLDNAKTRTAYIDYFNDRLEALGLRSVHEHGAQHYLDQVPDHMDLIAYQAPDGLRTTVNADGYISEGLDVEFDPDRPFSQRGVFTDRPRDPETVERISKQLGHLSTHLSRFAFDVSDLLGYRPVAQTDEGIDFVWQGWESTEV